MMDANERSQPRLGVRKVPGGGDTWAETGGMRRHS